MIDLSMRGCFQRKAVQSNVNLKMFLYVCHCDIVTGATRMVGGYQLKPFFDTFPSSAFFKTFFDNGEEMLESTILKMQLLISQKKYTGHFSLIIVPCH